MIAALAGAVAALPARAFSDCFADTTLRVDFVLSATAGTERNVTVAFSGLSRTQGWAGRRVNLDRVAVPGNGDVTMTDAVTGDTLYMQSFSTLFHEWLESGETHVSRAMEGTVRVPWPRREVDVTVTLRDNRRQRLAGGSIAVDPEDILIADRTARKPVEQRALFRGSEPDTAKIKVAILAEGFTGAEMDRFMDYARQTVNAILEAEPFASRAQSFDFTALLTASADSGVSVPVEGEWRRTAFDSHFSTFGSDRYLTSPSVHKIYDALDGADADHVIILANTDTYGGGGIFNFYTLTTTGHEQFRRVVVHEFGHSFAGLGDEYYYDTDDFAAETYPLDVEPWEANITTRVDFTVKWQPLIDAGEASLVEGGGYRGHGIWRGADDCRMRSNSAEGFCAVCRRAIEIVIGFYTER